MIRTECSHSSSSRLVSFIQSFDRGFISVLELLLLLSYVEYVDYAARVERYNVFPRQGMSMYVDERYAGDDFQVQEEMD